MQKFAFYSLLLCFFGMVTHTSLLAQTDSTTTVMGYTLGMHADSIPKTNLLKMGKFQKLMRYDRQDTPLKLAGIDLEWVRLFIWDNQLHSIEIKCREGQGDKMTAWLKSVYGSGKPMDAMGYRFDFYLPTMRVLWEQNIATKQGSAMFVDEAVNDKYYIFMEQR